MGVAIACAPALRRPTLDALKRLGYIENSDTVHTHVPELKDYHVDVLLASTDKKDDT